MCVSSPHSLQALKATLVWTDPASSIVARDTLINDLDLSIWLKGPNYLIHPNQSESPIGVM